MGEVRLPQLILEVSMALNPYRYSYSGSDTKVFARLSSIPETIHQLESVHTISVSVHEAKGQARALGYRGIKGLSRGVRTIAGSIILTIVEDHPLRQLMLETEKHKQSYRGGWSMDQNEIGVGDAVSQFNQLNRLVELLPPIDIFLTYVSEAGAFDAKTNSISANRTLVELSQYSGAAMLIRGVDFVDSGMVTSVNDIVSEITLSFIARDFKPISLSKIDVTDQAHADWTTEHSGDIRRQHGALEKLLYGDFPELSETEKLNRIDAIGKGGTVIISGGIEGPPFVKSASDKLPRLKFPEPI